MYVFREREIERGVGRGTLQQGREREGTKQYYGTQIRKKKYNKEKIKTKEPTRQGPKDRCSTDPSHPTSTSSYLKLILSYGYQTAFLREIAVKQ